MNAVFTNTRALALEAIAHVGWQNVSDKLAEVNHANMRYAKALAWYENLDRAHQWLESTAPAELCEPEQDSGYAPISAALEAIDNKRHEARLRMREEESALEEALKAWAPDAPYYDYD